MSPLLYLLFKLLNLSYPNSFRFGKIINLTRQKVFAYNNENFAFYNNFELVFYEIVNHKGWSNSQVTNRNRW